MATIGISDLKPAGYDLLYDSESYMTDLSKDELEIQGGIIMTITPWTPSIAKATVVIVVGGATIAATKGEKKPRN